MQQGRAPRGVPAHDASRAHAALPTLPVPSSATRAGAGDVDALVAALPAALARAGRAGQVRISAQMAAAARDGG